MCVQNLRLNARWFVASLLIDDSLCLLDDLARLIFLSLRPGAVGGHRRIEHRRRNDMEEFEGKPADGRFLGGPADSGVGRGRPIDTDNHLRRHWFHGPALR